MQHLSDTPPDGDFVRYVEHLTATNAAAALGERAGRLAPAKVQTVQHRSPVAASRPAVPASVATQPFANIDVWGHVKWLAALWVGIQLLASFVPGAGFLFFPALLAYVSWVILKANRDSSGALMHRIRELWLQAARAAQEAQKAPSTSAKNKNEN